MDEFNSHRINDETFDISDRLYLIYKNVFEDIKHNNRKIQPDLLAIQVKNGRITFYVIEEKTGDNFDTKKSSAEKEHLTIFSKRLKKLNVVPGMCIKYYIVPFFSEKSKDKLSKSGFKGHFTEDEILKRDELSEVFGIDFDDIVKLFEKVRDINKKMVTDDICGYSDLRSLISENPEVINDVINQICNNPQSVEPQTRRNMIEVLSSSLE
jgi:ribosomal protein S17E